MKTKIIAGILALIVCLCIGIAGRQATTRSFGGEMTIELDPNVKLEEITWKDNDLWYLTRPMTEDDVAETHTFQQSSNFGVLEGTVTIIESKE